MSQLPAEELAVAGHAAALASWHAVGSTPFASESARAAPLATLSASMLTAAAAKGVTLQLGARADQQLGTLSDRRGGNFCRVYDPNAPTDACVSEPCMTWRRTLTPLIQ